jgi:GNAT superfamily N-acetyltransferase
MVRLVWERLVARQRVYRVYEASSSQGAGAPDPEARSYDAAAPPPALVVALYRRHAGRLSASVMLGRLRRGLATLMVLLADDDLVAYGWLQTWAPMRREFWWLAQDGVCIGPFWTNPRFRGRGVYGRLLAHSLWEARRRFPERRLFIWARDENEASNRGIVKAGFDPLGRHQVVTLFGGLVRKHRPRESE